MGKTRCSFTIDKIRKYKVVILLRLGNITEAQSTLDTYYNLVSNMTDMSEEQDWVTETQHKLTRLYTTQ